jgi:hypothetical protein
MSELFRAELGEQACADDGADLQDLCVHGFVPSKQKFGRYWHVIVPCVTNCSCSSSVASPSHDIKLLPRQPSFLQPYWILAQMSMDCIGMARSTGFEVA